MRLIKINSKLRDYSVDFGSLSSFIRAKDKDTSAFYIVDKKVWILYRKSLLKGLDSSRVVLFEAEELNKTLRIVSWLYDAFIKRKAKRNIVLISIGGGITQDVSGFLSSTIFRGVRWLYIPTTLLSQADSCIGGKTSLNYKNYKNLIGTFYPPEYILIDINFNYTLREQDFYSGIGEIIKLHLMGGRRYFKEISRLLPGIIAKRKEYLLRGIRNSLLIKKGYIESDEFDSGRRNLLNYGHCFGHALETASGFKVPHGQAVVIGMMLANIVGRARGLLSPGVERKLFNDLLLPAVSVEFRSFLYREQGIISSMKKDKKRIGEKLPLIIMRNDFSFEKRIDLTEGESKLALRELAGRVK